METLFSASSGAALNSEPGEALTVDLPRAKTTLFSRTPNLRDGDENVIKARLREYFISTFDCYESLFETLACENAWYEKPITLRHPLIFYYGHTATFFVNKLLLSRLIDSRIDPKFESMFAVGVDEMSWDDLNDAHYAWPKPEAVKSYRDKVRAMVLDIIDTSPLSLPLNWNNPWWSIIMGVEHERIHLETSSVLIRQHNIHYVKPNENWSACDVTGDAPQNQLLPCSGGAVTIGKAKDDAYYGWDNEYGTHDSVVKPFEASQFLVSNQEFLAFVDAGGYRTTDFWTEEGKGWLAFTQAQYPTFWLKKNNSWQLRLMTEEVPMPWNWPVEVNYHEAKAFCNWKAIETGLAVRLPTEDEWYCLASNANLKNPTQKPINANLHLDYFASSCPVNWFKQGEFYDLVGNVWQWTETPIYPFEGFDVHPIYDDFTTPTFDERHNLIKGGSWISCGNEAQLESRYAFRRHFFQHAGFRYVIAEEAELIPSSHYETDKLLSEYAEFHYGDEYFGVKNFSKALSDLALSVIGDSPKRRALDLGCATGRASFELAQHFDLVTGIDFSARFIGLGVQLSQQGSIRYTLADEGDLVSYKSRNLSDLCLESTAKKVEFFQGDACNLKSQFSNYDLVLAANLIDRLYSPSKFLKQIHERICVGGHLMLASPYTWLTEHTQRDEWIGGFKKDGESFTTLDGLKQILSVHFELVHGPQEVPFVIRETKRKFQHTLSEVTIWKRIK